MKHTACLIAALLLAACSASVGEDRGAASPQPGPASESASLSAAETKPVNTEMPMSDPADPAEPGPDRSESVENGEHPAMAKVVKTDEEWRALLSDEEYRVTRQAGTERAFTGRYWNKKEPGTYSCVCCGLELFESDTKYDSGCGWPSFWKTLAGDRVRYIDDLSLGMMRTEVRCARCDAHLGHVFDDGPEPTGQRYCMNSVSLKFTPRAAGK